MNYRLRPALRADVDTILRWRAETATWLRGQGIDQWSNPFPRERLDATVDAGEVWMLVDDDQAARPVATITVTNHGDPDLWTPDELAEPAHYAHKLTLIRELAGQHIGSALLDWASRRAAVAGARWLRLDAWSTNPGLQAYYRDQGFEYLRTVSDPSIVSGALFQRPAGVERGDGPVIK
jgi:GNAT superfamily N-acetyltransferase